MKKYTLPFFLLFCLFALPGCRNYVAAIKDGRFENNVAIREMTYDIADLKVSLQQALIEINALEDRIQTQEATLISYEKTTKSSAQIADLDKRMRDLSAQQHATASELKSLSAHATMTTSSLSGYRNKIQELESKVSNQNSRLNEVGKLKQTLSSISKAMNTPKSDTFSAETYQVQSGDTLGSIALKHRTSVRKIKSLNNLNSNRIFAGQKLKVTQ